MKELSIEEKAERYDEAIKRIENIKTGKCETIFMFTEGLFEYIFSELKEREDERIRNNLIDYFSNCKALKFSEQEIVAWLEKQGEQKMKTEPKDVIDVPLIDIPFGAKDSELIGATYFIPKGFHAEIEDDNVIFKKGEQKSVWSEEDERIRGAICDTLDRIDEHIMKCHQRLTHQQVKDWLKSLKERMKK